MNAELYKDYPHNPPHLFRSNAVYMVTGATDQKLCLLDTAEKKRFFCQTLFERAKLMGWTLEAWAVLSNHYHWIAQAPDEVASLKLFIQAVHSITGRYINHLDQTPGRKVWLNYWDSCISYETSYLARLNYVHLNPVKHGVIDRAENYPFCSYFWFTRNADADFQQKVFAQPADRVHVEDAF